MSIFAKCVQEGCFWNKKITYVTYKGMFGHYYRKGREVLIELAKETGVSSIPYAESTYILADKLVKISQVKRP